MAQVYCVVISFFVFVLYLVVGIRWIGNKPVIGY